MKKIPYLLLVSLFVFTSCNQEDEIIDNAVKSNQDKVTVCHYDAEMDTWKTITINGNALKAHLKHGDVQLIDADGDGWVELENECVPGGDCDDTNPDINPGMEEICGNEIDDNCDGYVDENCRTYVPDDGFEYQLIQRGLDDVMDDYVLTSNIKNITHLYLSSTIEDNGEWGRDLGMYDLTGIEDFSSLTHFGISRTFHQLNEIDLSKNTALTSLSLSAVYGSICIPELDLSKNIALSYLNLDRVVCLTKLNLQNGNNLSLTFGEFDINLLYSDLSCIQVDDAEYSTANWSSEYTYSEDCGY